MALRGCGVSLAAIITAGAGFFAYVGLLLVGIHFLWQIRWLDIDNPHVCLMIFKSNRDVGAIVVRRARPRPVALAIHQPYSLAWPGNPYPAKLNIRRSVAAYGSCAVAVAEDVQD